jgi:hypothetical protein
MNPFYAERCPLCGRILMNEYTPFMGPHAYNLFVCSPHYFYSQDIFGQIPIKSEISILNYHLIYTPDQTTIYQFDGPEQNYYHYIFTFKGHFPIDWKNPSEASNRIKNMLIFS